MSSKFFPNLHANFDNLNPEAIPQEWLEPDTYDENGQLHSYDDKPAMKVEYADNTAVFFKWYNHGIIGRQGNKPPIVSAKQSTYITYNAEEEEHSFDGKPSYIYEVHPGTLDEPQLWLEWSANGLPHRDEDLPAKCIYTKDKLTLEAYYSNGTLTRFGGKPASVKKTEKLWRIHNVPHNANGPEFEKYSKYGSLVHDKYALYGVSMSQELYNEISDYHLTNRAPLWVAFLHKLDFITEEQLSFAEGDDKQWENSLPDAWLIRCYGLNEQACMEKLEQLKISKTILDFDMEIWITGFLKTITEITKLEKQNDVASSSEKGKRHV